MLGRLHIVPLLGCALGLALTVVTACDSRSPSSSQAVACCAPASNARVIGLLVGIGGPSGTAVQHWAGTIRVLGHTRTTVRTDGRGHFSIRLAAGRYRFVATSPTYDGGRGECRAAGPVRLRSHHTTRVRVVCQLK